MLCAIRVSGGRLRVPSLRSLVRAGALLGVLLVATRVQAQGIFLTGTGPINQSMGGAAVAAPLDSAGALNWNPASISGLSRSEMAMALGIILPTTSLSSDAFGLSGTTYGGSGPTPVPTMSFVMKSKDSPWTWGVGVYGIGGFSANFASNALGPTANPILTPQTGLGGVGVGRIYSNAQIYQISPTVSYALTEKLSFGISPTIDLANVQADPLFLAPQTSPLVYGPGTGSSFNWGAGVQVGMYYIINSNWRFGASYKSTQWFAPFHFQSNDVLGNPVFNTLSINLPSITSIGAAYTGIDRLLWAVDVRYFDYAHTAGFGGSGFGPPPGFAVQGLGWRSVVSVSNGLQYSFTDKFALRGGYTYVDNPVPSSQEFFNVGTSLIMKHFLSCGASYKIRQNVMANVAYTHGFQASLTGPYQTPIGAIPGTSVTSSNSVDWIQAGLTVLF